MNKTVTVQTVTGRKKLASNTVTLPHEHICCFSAYLRQMSDGYLDRDGLVRQAVGVLKHMKEQYGLGLFVDCTPLNIGRDTDLLKEVSEQSQVDIVCSTGFYYNEEPIPNCMSAQTLAGFIRTDAKKVGAGIIKAAVEQPVLTDFQIKLLQASAIAHKETGLPIVLHTNAANRNGTKAAQILTEAGVDPHHITVGHLSDTDDADYVKTFAQMGCYVALDRLYGSQDEAYLQSKVRLITALCDAGYTDRILLSHDDAVFQGFSANPQLQTPRWNYLFDCILPRLNQDVAQIIAQRNPLAMLCGH